MRSHIRKCERYSGIAYKQIKRLPTDLTVNDLKVIFDFIKLILAEIDLCREYVEELIFNKK